MGKEWISDMSLPKATPTVKLKGLRRHHGIRLHRGGFG